MGLRSGLGGRAAAEHWYRGRARHTPPARQPLVWGRSARDCSPGTKPRGLAGMRRRDRTCPTGVSGPHRHRVCKFAPRVLVMALAKGSAGNVATRSCLESRTDPAPLFSNISLRLLFSYRKETPKTFQPLPPHLAHPPISLLYPAGNGGKPRGAAAAPGPSARPRVKLNCKVTFFFPPSSFFPGSFLRLHQVAAITPCPPLDPSFG